MPCPSIIVGQHVWYCENQFYYDATVDVVHSQTSLDITVHPQTGEGFKRFSVVGQACYTMTKWWDPNCMSCTNPGRVARG